MLEHLRTTDASLPIAVLFAAGNWRHAVRLAIGLRSVAFHPEAGQVGRPMITACRQAQLPERADLSALAVSEGEIARITVRAETEGGGRAEALPGYTHTVVEQHVGARYLNKFFTHESMGGLSD